MKQPRHFHAPIYDMLRNHLATNPVSFHVPGHRFGSGIVPLEQLDMNAAAFFEGMMKLDVTELSVTDDLHDPTGAIAKAQELAAECFGAEQSYFLVGGSTSGNLAMLLACCSPGDLVLVQRNAHKSIINGLTLAGAKAVFLMPEMDTTTGLQIPPSLTVVEEALALYPNARAVLLTSPSYYGLSVHLSEYASLIHAHGKILLVDEAHGAHYGHHPRCPGSALAAGADAVVQSTHKTLTALTMGAMLHIQGSRIDRQALRHALQMIQSSSPSYPIMASLDISRALIDSYGADWFQPGIGAADAFKEWLAREGGRIEAVTAVDERVRLDPLRILIKDKFGLLTGYELQRRLEQQGCWAEMASSTYVVLLFGTQTSSRDVERLKVAILSIMDASCGEPGTNRERMAEQNIAYRPISEPVVFSRVQHVCEPVPLKEAAGRLAGEAVIPYPPGIPILYPGEPIMPNAIQAIAQMALQGARFQGAADGTMNTIQVRTVR